MGTEVDSLDLALVAQAQSALKTMDEIIGKTSQMHTAIAKMMDSLSGNAFKREAEATKKSSKEMSDSLIRDFGITNREAKKKISELSTILANMQKDLANGLTVDTKKTQATFVELGKTIKENAKISTAYTKDLIEALSLLDSMGKIYISDKIVGDLGNDWTSGYGKNNNAGLKDLMSGRIARTQGSFRGVDSVYGELSSQMPSVFNPDITDTTEQFRRIVEVVQEARDAIQNGANDAEGQVLKSSHAISEAIKSALGDVRDSVGNAKSDIPDLSSFNLKEVFGGADVGEIATNLSTLAKSMSEISQVHIGDTGLTSFAESVKSLNKTDFDRVSSGMERFGSVIKNFSFGASELANAGAGLQQLVPSIAQLKAVEIGDIGKIQRRIDKLASINYEGLNKSAQAIYKMSNSLKKLSDIGTSGETLEGFAKSINKLGYKSTAGAVENLPKLGTALRQVMNTLSQSPTVSKNVIEMTNALANLSQSMKGVSTQAPRASSGLKGFFSSINRSHSGFKGLASSIGMFYAKFWMLLRGFQQAKKAIDLSSSLTEVQNVVNHTFGAMTDKVNDFAQNVALAQYGMSELTSKQFASRFQAMSNAMGITNTQMEKATGILDNLGASYEKGADGVEDMSLNITKLTADYASFFDEDLDSVAEKMNSIWTGQTRPLILAA